MNDIINYLINTINNFDHDIQVNSATIKRIEDKLQMLDAIANNPDVLSSSEYEELLDECVSERIRTSNDYLNMKKLVGNYSAYRNESQIVLYHKYVKTIASLIKTESLKKVESLKEMVQELNIQRKEYQEVYELISNYNEDTYLDNSDLRKINELVSNLNVSQEIIDFYFMVAQNNAKIVNRSFNIQEASIEDIPDVDLSPEGLSKEDEQIIEPEVKEEIPAPEPEKHIIDTLLKKCSPYITNNKKLPVEFKKHFSNIKEVLTKYPQDDLEEMWNFLVDGVEIKDLIVKDNPEEIKVVTALAIINAMDNNQDYQKIISDFNSVYKITIKEKELQRLNSILDSLEIDIDEEEKEKIVNFAKAYSSLDENMQKESLKTQFQNEISFEEYKIKRDYIKLKEYLKTIGETKKTTLELYGKIQVLIEDLRDRVNNYSDRKEVETVSETNIKDAKNYLIFISPETFEGQIADYKQNDFSYSALVNKLSLLIESPTVKINNSMFSHNIHLEKGKPNPYGIRATRGSSLRIGFKILNNVKIDGQLVIMIFGISPGKVNENAKRDGLLENIRIYNKNIQEIENIQKLFENAKSFDELDTRAKVLIDKGILTYRKFENSSMQEKASVMNDGNPGLGGRV